MAKITCRVFALSFAAVFILAASQGCTKRQDSPPPQTESSPPAETAEPSSAQPRTLSSRPKGDFPSLTQAVELWKQGKGDQAVEVFAGIRWATKVDFGPTSPFSISEREFGKLSSPQRQQRLQQIMEEFTHLRSLCKAVLEKAQSVPNGAKYIDASAGFADAIINDPHALAILTAFATAVQQKAAELKK